MVLKRIQLHRKDIQKFVKRNYKPTQGDSGFIKVLADIIYNAKNYNPIIARIVKGPKDLTNCSRLRTAIKTRIQFFFGKIKEKSLKLSKEA